MGHSQMLLAVAGLKDKEIKERTTRLATGNWSSFKPAEQLAFAFAHRLTREPARITDREMNRLTQALGRHRVVDLIWYGSWCNYMTRVADAVQFPLERENCFAPPPPKKKKP